MRWRTDDVLGRAEGRHLLERKGTHSDLAPAFAQTICILQGSFGQFFLIPVQPAGSYLYTFLHVHVQLGMQYIISNILVKRHISLSK